MIIHFNFLMKRENLENWYLWNLHFVTQPMTYLMYLISHFSDVKLFMIIMDIWNTSFFCWNHKSLSFNVFVFQFACVYFLRWYLTSFCHPNKAYFVGFFPCEFSSQHVLFTSLFLTGNITYYNDIWENKIIHTQHVNFCFNFYVSIKLGYAFPFSNGCCTRSNSVKPLLTLYAAYYT